MSTIQLIIIRSMRKWQKTIMTRLPSSKKTVRFHQRQFLLRKILQTLMTDRRMPPKKYRHQLLIIFRKMRVKKILLTLMSTLITPPFTSHSLWMEKIILCPPRKRDRSILARCAVKKSAMHYLCHVVTWLHASNALENVMINAQFAAKLSSLL